ncbi:Hypothetical predicted protein [Olea europaea subsp. europaea]|uniref:Uncharacterized protein n=1 Tax=Olea europaea subsp. europaea TaxID=158383 RepID=A0A8S0QBL0_OLEEU|nr:Hypothetical predicted protein [Olea europaea subsp. europaea]
MSIFFLGLFKNSFELALLKGCNSSTALLNPPEVKRNHRPSGGDAEQEDKEERRRKAGIYPRNKYSGNPPDFGLLASLDLSFEPARRLLFPRWPPQNPTDFRVVHFNGWKKIKPQYPDLQTLEYDFSHVTEKNNLSLTLERTGLQIFQEADDIEQDYQRALIHGLC